MPGQITHIVYCQKFLAQNQIADPGFSYLIGNLIPDIRYLGVLDRKASHINLDDRAWEKVSELVLGPENKEIELFRKGVLFHSFLDSWWGDQFKSGQMDWYKTTALKIYQDIQLFPLIKNSTQLREKLHQVTSIYQLKEVEQIEFIRWIAVLTDYLEIEPTLKNQVGLLKKYQVLPQDRYQPLEEALENIPLEERTQFLRTFEEFEPKNIPSILLT